MRNFKNNFRRNKYKNHSDRNNHRGENGKVLNDFQNGSNFIRKNAGRNNHNAPKLIEKYSNLAREALSNGDKILSENYMQHAEHFIRNSENGVNKTNGFNEKKNELKSVNEANINKFKQEDIKQEEETQVKES